MAQRETRINGVRLYSDNLEGDNNSKSKTVTTYKKVQSTTKTVTKAGSNPSQTTITKKTAITKNFGVPRHSVGSIKPQIKETVAEIKGHKEKFMYSGKLKEKENYLYYVSGIGYVNKDGVPTKPDNKPKEIKVLSNKPKPMRKVEERVTITLQSTRPERKGGELLENFEYHETKEIGKKNKESLVVHRRLGDPFYQNIKGGRSSSYTQVQRSKNIIEGKDTTIKTRTIQTTTTQRKQYENNTYNTGANAQQNSRYNRTTNQRIEKNFAADTNKRRSTSQETKKTEPKKYVPTQKKYQEKTDDTHKRRTQTQTQTKPAENKRVYDTNKYNTNRNNAGNNKPNVNANVNANVNQSKYQQKTEETQKTEFSQENNNLLNDPNY